MDSTERIAHLVLLVVSLFVLGDLSRIIYETITAENTFTLSVIDSVVITFIFVAGVCDYGLLAATALYSLIAND